LTDYAIFGLWIFYGLVTAAVFILVAKCRTPSDPIAPGISGGADSFPAGHRADSGMTLWGVRDDAAAGASLIIHGHLRTGFGVLARNPPLAGIV